MGRMKIAARRLLCAIATLFAVSFIAGVGLPTQAEATTCKALMLDFIAQLRAFDGMAAREMITNIDEHCPPDNRVAARTNLGFLVARLTSHERSKGVAPEDIIAEATPYLLYGDHWHLRRSLGQLSLEARHYDDAAEHYFKALELIQDPGFTPKPPSADEIRTIHSEASEALTLAEQPKAPKTRGGRTAAYYGARIRGVAVPRKTPQITFVTDTANFDSQGTQQMDEVAPILKRETPDAIVVIGHTDERGSDEHNLALSEERANMVRKTLVDRGFSGTIRARWCGKKVPVDIVSPGRFNQEEIWRINRRVEVYYGQGGQEEPRYAECKG